MIAENGEVSRHGATAPDVKLQWLAEYANRGWRTFPVWEIASDVCACGDVTCKSPGKHPRISAWQTVATTDLGQLTRWHHQWPEANWGWALDRHLVLDVDPRNGAPGPDDLDNWWSQAFGWSLPHTLTQRTGGGGLHVVLDAGLAPLRSGKLRLDGRAVRGLDLRGVGGFVIVAPSMHASGARYEWVDFRVEPASVPEQLRDQQERRSLQAVDGGEGDAEHLDFDRWLASGSDVPSGEQRDWLIRGIGWMRGRSYSRGTMLALAGQVAERFVNYDPARPWTPEDVLTAVDSAMASWDARAIPEPWMVEWARNSGTTEAEPFVIPPLFEKGIGFLVEQAVDTVETLGPIAVDDRARLYRFADGIWRDDAEREVRHRLSWLLGDRYRPSHAGAVLDVLENRPPRFTSETQDTRHLNLPNGLLDWESGELRPHDPNVASFARIPVEWRPMAMCPAIDSWLHEVFPADAVELAYEVIGYALFNGNPLHKAVLLHGSGRNGKSTFLRLIKELIGSWNVSSVTPQSLDDNRFRAAELYGKLANLVGDVDPRIFKATEVFKALTGDDLVTAERKHGHPFQFRCRALMIAAFNALPRSADTSEGFFSRWIVVPFTRFFPAGVANPGLIDKLTTPEELEGLLVRSVWALRQVIGRHAFTMPASVAEQTAEFRRVADPVRAFMSEMLTADPAGFVPRTQLKLAFDLWCTANGHAQMSGAALYERVEAASPDIWGAPSPVVTLRGTRGFRMSWLPSADGTGL